MEWEKIFARHKFEKGLISRQVIYHLSHTPSPKEMGAGDQTRGFEHARQMFYQ
jgi:hypothetical protein